ncbi:hypothetical protein OBBRIDRAFT_884984 [Obba rivulosa]|uniref:Uncharacterized protein n=1 Tax=Obba rivulosa TaxID=1052685 RepID=A0A8E2DR55_9APHY|nr:hypothetical protein OBBRIDRAFT_884984 [Obba rivulosa]
MPVPACSYHNMTDAFRHLAGLIRSMNNTSFFTITEPDDATVANSDGHVAHVKSCKWARKSVKGSEWGIHYTIILPGSQRDKNIYVDNAEKAGPKACQEALAVGIEWYADNPELFTYDVDAMNYV